MDKYYWFLVILLIVLMGSAWSLIPIATAKGKGRWKLWRIITFIALVISAMVVYGFGSKYEADHGIYSKYYYKAAQSTTIEPKLNTALHH